MAETEKIFIEFIADSSGLQPAVDKLQDLGLLDKKAADAFKQTTAEINKQAGAIGKLTVEVSKEQEVYNKLVGSLKTLSGESKKGVERILSQSAKQISDSFDKAGTSVDDYIDLLHLAEGQTQKTGDEAQKTGAKVGDLGNKTKKTGEETETVRQKLKALTLQLQDLRDQGQQNTQQYQDLNEEAARLDDVIDKTGKTIKRVGSDTRVFDGLINAAQGLAGGFAIVQGASALFGSESEELQETLVKLNSAMAILQGLQQVQQVLSKESAASLLFLNTQQKVAIAQTELETVVQGKNTIAKNLAAGAQRLLSTVMALANPITLAVVAVITAVTLAYKFFTQEAKEAREAQKLFNLELEASIKIGEESDENLKKVGERRRSELKKQGATEGQLRKDALNDQAKLVQESDRRLRGLREQFAAADKKARETKSKEDLEIAQKTLDLIHQLEKTAADRNQAFIIATNEDIELTRKEQLEKDKKAIEERQKLHDEGIKKERERLEQVIAGLQLEQIGLDKTSFAWKNLEAAIINNKAALETLETTGNKTKLALAQAAEQIELLFKPQIANVDETAAALLKANQEALKNTKITGEKILTERGKINNAIVVTDKQAADAQKEIDKQLRDAKIANFKETAEFALQSAAQVAATVGELFKQQSDRELARVDEQKKEVNELADAGAITAKEQTERLKKLDAEEKKIKQEAAKRDKAIALFQALISTAAGIAKAIPNPVLIAIAAAVGAAQIAAIASRPIPKFGKGKKDRYQGFGEIAETGPEILQRGGSNYLVKKRSIVYLAPEDKIYNPKETERMMGVSINSLDRGVMKKGGGFTIDYDELGKAVGNNIPQTIWGVTNGELTKTIKDKLSYTTYLNQRRGN